MPHIIGYRRFGDGSVRAVYEDESGRQFVIGADWGERLYGVWLVPAAA